MPYDFFFHDILERRGFNPAECRLLRHDRGARREFRRSRHHFWSHVSFQNSGTSNPFLGAKFFFNFVPTKGFGSLFVGAHSIDDEWTFGEGVRRPRFHVSDPAYPPQPTDIAYDLTVLTDFEDLEEKVEIDWGASTRS